MKKIILFIVVLTLATGLFADSHSCSYQYSTWGPYSTQYRRINSGTWGLAAIKGTVSSDLGFSISWTTYGMGHSTGYAVYTSAGYKGYDSYITGGGWSTTYMYGKGDAYMNDCIYPGRLERIRPYNANYFSNQNL